MHIFNASPPRRRDLAVDRPRWLLTGIRKPRLFSPILGPPWHAPVRPRAHPTSRKGPRRCPRRRVPPITALHVQCRCRWCCKAVCLVVTFLWLSRFRWRRVHTTYLFPSNCLFANRLGCDLHTTHLTDGSFDDTSLSMLLTGLLTFSCKYGSVYDLL